MTNKLPTLSPTGTLSDAESIANKLFIYFISSEYSQTYFYADSVSSLKYLIGKYKNINDLEENIIATLITMYNRYFVNTEVKIKIENIKDSDVMKTLKIDVITFNDSKEIKLSRTITIDNDKIEYINEHSKDLYKK